LTEVPLRDIRRILVNVEKMKLFEQDFSTIAGTRIQEAEEAEKGEANGY
jgi:hypothetical protein